MEFDRSIEIFSGSYTVIDGAPIAVDHGPLVDADLPNRPTLDQIRRLESAIGEEPQLTIEPVHHFAKGMYAREITVPAGAVIVGKMHRHQHLMIMTRGDATVYTDKGMQRVRAPHMWVSEPGAKRVGYMHEESTFITFHATEETEIEKIEAEAIIADEPVAIRLDDMLIENEG